MDLDFALTILNPFLFFKRKDHELLGLFGRLVDVTLAAGTREFAMEEGTTSSKFDFNNRGKSLSLLFGGSKILECDVILVSLQHSYANKLKKMSLTDFTSEEFAHLRRQFGYLATSTRPVVA